jgi:hypothetical protein
LTLHHEKFIMDVEIIGGCPASGKSQTWRTAAGHAVAYFVDALL